MRKIVLLFFLILTCVELSAQNYYLRSLDLDTGLNLIRNAYLSKTSKEITIVSSTYLLDTADAYNRYVLKTHFTKLDSSNQRTTDKSFILYNSSIRIRGTIKLLQEGYVSYGLYYDSKAVSNKTAGIPGCIIRYNSNGDSIFTKQFPYQKDESEISSFRQLADSSFIFVCILKDSNGAFTSLSALRVVKLNPNFNITWDSVYYFSDGTDITVSRPMDYVDAIVQTSDNGFLIGTSIYIDTASLEFYATIFKIDSNGKFLWEKKYYGNEYERSVINRIIKLRDGDYLLMGYYGSYFNLDPKVTDFAFIIKINAQGQVLWQRMIGKYEYQYMLDIDEFPNGNILIAGQIDVRGNTHVYDMKASLFCFNKNGVLLWDRQYKAPSNRSFDEIIDVHFTDIEIADDNSILGIGNYTISDSSFPHNGGNDQDLLFFHSDSLGCIMPGTCPITNIETLPQEPNYFYTYPNPTSSTISFKSNLTQTSTIQIKIINAIGQIVLQKTLSDFKESIDVSDYAKGIYFIELSTDGFVGREKVVVD